MLGPDGVLADSKGDEGHELLSELTVSGPMWIAAQATGPAHDSVLGPSVFAHTSPVYVEVDGRGVARTDSARWCLEWLDRVEALARAHGRFDTEDQLNDLLAVLDAARGFYGNLAEPTDRG